MRAMHELPAYAAQIPFRAPECPRTIPGSWGTRDGSEGRTQRFSPVSAALVMHQPHEIPYDER